MTWAQLIHGLRAVNTGTLPRDVETPDSLIQLGWIEVGLAGSWRLTARGREILRRAPETTADEQAVYCALAEPVPVLGPSAGAEEEPYHEGHGRADHDPLMHGPRAEGWAEDMAAIQRVRR